MPRPGPRPYECIRRAWHSESHQPLRGRLIQEIFRLVNDLHDASIRRKKEWQDKLPIVVFRAEEILYSKANSENEYMDVKTLRTRLDDAVNTMIRREEDNEGSGPFLQPCVEAALSLGCTPKRGIRGNRQGSRFLINEAGPTKPTPFTQIFAVSNGPKFGTAPSLPCSFNSLAMQDVGSSSMYCEATRSLFTTHHGSSNAMYSRVSPLCSGVDCSPFYNMDGSLDLRVVEGSRTNGQLASDPMFPSACSPEFMRTLELGQVAALPSVWNIPTYVQSLAPSSQESKRIQEFPTSGGITTTSCLSSSPSCLSRLFNLDAVAQTKRHVDNMRCKTIGNEISPLVDLSLQLHIPHSVSNDMQSSRTCMQGTEDTSSSSLHEFASFCYEETVCSPKRLSLKGKPILSAITETESVAAFSEHHDLQLRLAPPSESDKLTCAEHNMTASGVICSAPNAGPWQQRIVNNMMKVSPGTYEVTSDVCIAASISSQKNAKNRMRDSNLEEHFPADCWVQDVECKKDASNNYASTSLDCNMHTSKRRRIELPHASNSNWLQESDFASSKPFQDLDTKWL